jgi:HSP20 family molecular chaperone IbpA
MHASMARRAFEVFENTSSRPRTGRLAHKAEAELLHTVHINIMESDEELTFPAEAPGFDIGELEVSLEPRRADDRRQQGNRQRGKEGGGNNLQGAVLERAASCQMTFRSRLTQRRRPQH